MAAVALFGRSLRTDRERREELGRPDAIRGLELEGDEVVRRGCRPRGGQAARIGRGGWRQQVLLLDWLRRARCRVVRAGPALDFGDGRRLHAGVGRHDHPIWGRPGRRRQPVLTLRSPPVWSQCCCLSTVFFPLSILSLSPLSVSLRSPSVQYVVGVAADGSGRGREHLPWSRLQRRAGRRWRSGACRV